MPNSLFLLLLTLVSTYAGWSYFSETPFIQQEAIGQAFWYACDGTPLLHTLFEPFKNDEFPGRFRYIEYLFEGAYWNLMKWGWLPRALYDYSALLISILLAGLIYQIAKLKKLGKTEILLILAFFLLGIPSFMIVGFHYRKAKFLVSLLLACQAYLQLADVKKQSYSFPLILIAATGVLTDPYFILLAPPLAIFLGWQRREWRGVRSCAAGMVFGFILVALLNGWIGPHINPNTKLVVGNLQITNPHFLQWRNIPHLYSIVLDTLGLLTPFRFAKITGWLITFVFLALCFALKKSGKPFSFLAVFLISLPLCAFLVFPDRRHLGMYASYYGHPVFFLFILALLDLMDSARQTQNKVILSLSLLLVLGLTWNHQRARRNVFQSWKEAHFKGSDRVAKVYAEESQEIRRLSRLFRSTEARAELDLDFSHHVIHQFTNAYQFSPPHSAHTSLAYVLTPILFQKEIKEGRLKIVEKTASNTQYWSPVCGSSSMRF